MLPVEGTVNSILLFQFDELATNLNKGCVDKDGKHSLCQLYKINLKSKSNTNIKLKGSLAFNNEDVPNLSWILLGDNYSSSTNYTSSMLGNTFNKATSTHTNFVDDYLLKSGEEVTYYILLWVNEIDEIQYDNGTYGGIVKFEDHNGEGVTAEFGELTKYKNVNIFAENVMKPVAISDSSVDFSESFEYSGPSGIYVRSGTENDKYPIYYYRGEVDNNLIFANFCWKVVRTTETGGLKLIYNGVPKNGQCNNTGSETLIGSKSFGPVGFNDDEEITFSLANVGYMYSNPYPINVNLDSNEFIGMLEGSYFGNDVSYSNGMYTLTDVKTFDEILSSEDLTLFNNHHYICLNKTTT